MHSQAGTRITHNSASWMHLSPDILAAHLPLVLNLWLVFLPCTCRQQPRRHRDLPCGGRQCRGQRQAGQGQTHAGQWGGGSKGRGEGHEEQCSRGRGRGNRAGEQGQGHQAGQGQTHSGQEKGRFQRASFSGRAVPPALPCPSPIVSRFNPIQPCVLSHPVATL